MKLNHTTPAVGRKSTRENKGSTQLFLVLFTNFNGMKTQEIVKAFSFDELHSWIEKFKADYGPRMTHSIQQINKARIADKINIA